MASLMIIPAVFAFSGGDESTLNAGPSLMFITMPKIFASMGFGRIIGILFFALVLFAAVTSAIININEQMSKSHENMERIPKAVMSTMTRDGGDVYVTVHPPKG
jgi:SNF family Na+-dependent transporter